MKLFVPDLKVLINYFGLVGNFWNDQNTFM